RLQQSGGNRARIQGSGAGCDAKGHRKAGRGGSMRRIVLALASITAPLLGATDARQWADYWADAYGLQRELVYAVIEVESGWNYRAVSDAGAAGLMQLMPGTAVAFRVRNRFDVAENIRGGVAYLAWLMDYFGGDMRLAVA